MELDWFVVGGLGCFHGPGRNDPETISSNTNINNTNPSGTKLG